MAELTTAPEYALWDESNHLLAICDAVLTTGLITTSNGIRLGLTIRTPSTTTTVVLDRLEAKAWLDQLARAVQGLPEPGDDDAAIEPT